MTPPPLNPVSVLAAMTALLMSCADPGASPPGGGENTGGMAAPDQGGAPGETDATADADLTARYEDGPGPLSPRVENETCRLPAAPPVGAMRLAPAFADLSFDRLLWMGAAPNDDRFIYFIEQGGRILVADAGNPVSTKVFLEEEVRRGHNEEGLLGMAFHPEYTQNGRFYIYYSASNPVRTVLSEFQRSAARETVADPTTERVLLEIEQPFGNHFIFREIQNQQRSAKVNAMVNLCLAKAAKDKNAVE